MLQAWRIKDAKRLASLANDTEVSRYLRDSFPYPYSLDDAIGFINFALKTNEALLLAITYKDEIVGGLSIVFKDDVSKYEAELGYWIGRDYFNRGIVTEAVKEAVNYVFSNYNIKRIYAEVIDENVGSLRVLEKNAFDYEGRLKKSVYKAGKFYDKLVYAIVK